ncbi:DMT family transporter [Sphingomonas sp.]|uniref:DMT family transporter n=1 Tax=Sphingomonas sp. TaxID=28214 RepID=UPI0035C7E911
MATSDNILRAIGLRLASVALFGVMNVLIKLAEAGGAALPEILFWRQFGASWLVIGVVLAGPGLASLRTARFGAHVGRAAVGLVSMGCTFTALILLPLAEATTLGFSMPIFATILGALVLGEPTGWRRWAAVLVGFAGVLIVAQPGSGHFPLAGAVFGIAAAILVATVSILLRQIGRTEAPLTTVFWFSVLSLPPLGLLYAFYAQEHPPTVWLLLVGLGLAGGAGQIVMTSSLRLGSVSAVVPMDYTALIWATLFGWLAFDHLPTRATWIGAAVIVASGLYIVWREHLRRQEETRQALGAPVD